MYKYLYHCLRLISLSLSVIEVLRLHYRGRESVSDSISAIATAYMHETVVYCTYSNNVVQMYKIIRYMTLYIHFVTEFFDYSCSSANGQPWEKWSKILHFL